MSLLSGALEDDHEDAATRSDIGQVSVKVTVNDIRTEPEGQVEEGGG